MKRAPVIGFVILLCLLFVLSCSHSEYTGATGSITFRAVWENHNSRSAPLEADVYKAAPAGVETVRIIISNPSTTTIQQGFPAAAGSGTINNVPVGTANLTIEGLDTNNAVMYRGRIDGVIVNAGQNTDCGTITLIAIPAAPTAVTAVAGDGQVKISWNLFLLQDGSVDYSVNYVVYWSTSPGVTKSSANELSGMNQPVNGIGSYTHTGLTNGTKYYYVVTTLSNGIHPNESEASAEVSASPTAGATMPLTTAASSIADITAVLNGSFDNPSGYTTTSWFEYGPTTAYGSSSGSTAYTQTGNINMTASLSGLTERTTFHYRVVTSNIAGMFYGNDMTFTTLYTPRTLATGLNQPYRIVIDPTSSDVFFTENTWPNGTISKVSTDGTVTAVITSLNYPTRLKIDSNHFYWLEGTGPYQLNRAPRTGGAPTTLATDILSPYALAIDATSVYWTENVEAGGGSLKKVSKDGGAVTTLAGGLSSPKGLRVDSSSVYWTENGQSIKKVGINGGTVTVLVGLSSSAFGLGERLASDPSYVYFLENSYVKKVSVDGSSPITITYFNFQYYDGRLFLDSSSIYSVSRAGVYRISLSDGSVSPLVSDTSIGAYSVIGATVDAANIYWTNAAGKILHVPKN